MFLAPHKLIIGLRRISWFGSVMLLLHVSMASGQTLAPKSPDAAYVGWVNARKPPSISGDNWQTIPTGRSALPEFYDVFWRATLATESYGGRQFRKDGSPLPGSADAGYRNIISIGISQSRYDLGAGGSGIFNEAKPYSPYLRNQSWDLKRYLWDPAYNAAIGFGYYGKAMRTAAGNNPCLGYAYYNGGPGGLINYKAAKFRPTTKQTTMISAHVANFVRNSRKMAGPYKEQVDKILQTSPGCNVGMDDVEPLPPLAAPPEGGGESQVHILGYCDPKAIDMLTNHYRAQQRDLDDTLEPLYRAVKRPYAGTNGGTGGVSGTGNSTGTGAAGSTGANGFSDSVNNISACVNLSWPNVSFQGPTMDQLIKAAEKQIVKVACEKARATVADTKSKLNQQFYFNPRIPGVPSSGVTISTNGSP